MVVTYFVGLILRDVLGAISALNYPEDMMRLIVVASPDDNRAKECFDMFKANHHRLRADLLVVHENSADLSRNEGIRASECEYVLLVEDDVLVNSATLGSLMELIRPDPLMAAVASPAIGDTPTLGERLQFGRFFGRIGDAYTVMPCTLFRRSLVMSCGLYREDMGPPSTIHEDWELGSRLRERGFKVLVDGGVTSRHLNQQTDQRLPTVHVSDGASRNHGKGGFVGRVRRYVSEYLHRNWWSMLQVMKAGPVVQTAEYVGYALVPALLLLLVSLDFEFGLLLAALSLVAVSLFSLAKGYYRVYGLKRRVTYPVIMASIRVFRTYLFILGLAVNLRDLNEKP